jgi:hypothetical protein
MTEYDNSADGQVQPVRRPDRPQQAWTRDHILGLFLLGVDAIEREGQGQIAAELRHLIRTLYTYPGLRRGDLRSGASARRGAKAAR